MRPLQRSVYIALVALVFLLTTNLATAQSVAKLDPRAVAVGGAYVAVADGWAAIQWNPAGLFPSGRNELGIATSYLPLEGGAWVEALRTLHPSGVGGLGPREAQQLINSKGSGLAGETQSFGVYLSSQRWGVGFQQVHYADELGSSRGDYTELSLSNLRTREFMLSLAQPIAQGKVVFGGTVKLVNIQAQSRWVGLENISFDSLEARKLLEMARQDSVDGQNVFTFDIGILIIPTNRFRLGATGKNLYQPEIDSGSERFTHLNRQVRAGLMFLLTPQLRLSADLDLLTEKLAIPGRLRREAGGGLEWLAGTVAVRGGLLFDLEAVDSKPLLTFGLGFMADSWRVDGAGTYGNERDGFGFSGALAAEW